MHNSVELQCKHAAIGVGLGNELDFSPLVNTNYNTLLYSTFNVCTLCKYFLALSKSKRNKVKSILTQLPCYAIICYPFPRNSPIRYIVLHIVEQGAGKGNEDQQQWRKSTAKVCTFSLNHLVLLHLQQMYEFRIYRQIKLLLSDVIYSMYSMVMVVVVEVVVSVNKDHGVQG